MTRLGHRGIGGVDVLCSDKTGTLTQNKLTLGDPFSVNGIPGDQVVLDAGLARVPQSPYHRPGGTGRPEK